MLKSKLARYLERNNISVEEASARTGYALSNVYRNIKFGIISDRVAGRYAECFFEDIQTFKDSKKDAETLLRVWKCLKN